MTDRELVQALRRIAADNHRCFGCGYEHNCNIHGCQIIKAAADTIARLSEHVGQVEQERDAAIADLRHSDPCEVCRWSRKNPSDCDVECLACERDCQCRICNNEDKWEWRGPKGESQNG